LVKSKFSDIDSNKVYILPDDGSIEVDEGSFVRVQVEKEVKDNELDRSMGKGSVIGMSRTYAQVGGLETPRIPLPPPVLPMDEFMERISSGWKDPQEDHLDWIISLLMVSSPRSIIGEGGLGSEGIQRERGVKKGTNRDLADMIMAQLPLEFRTSGTAQYKYSKIENIGDIKLIGTKRIAENCYSLVPDRIYEAMVQRNIPIQLPFVVRNAELRKREMEIDLDVLDYQLTGLYLPPPSEKVQEERFHGLIKDLKKEEFWDMGRVGELDPNAGMKIELALTRLFLGKRFKGDGYGASRTDTSEGIDIIRKLMRYGFENFRMKVKEEDYFRSQRTEPWREKLEPIDKEIYLELRKTNDEQGIDLVSRDSIKPGLDRAVIDGSLERLNRYGYVLQMKNGTMIKIVVTDDPERLS